MTNVETEEVWKDVVGYEGLYAVSSFGNVANIRRNRKLRLAGHRTGYVSVVLYKNNVPKRMLVHRLVAYAFVDKPDGKDFVNHIDENKENNSACNLEWRTKEQNMQHGSAGQRISEKRGHLARNKRKVVQIDMNGKVVATWDSIASAAKNTKTARTSIFECCNKIHKSANGFMWAYA